MKAVLISIHPKWCELIASSKKTVEVRKTKPKLETPFKVYIYETQGRTETPLVDEEGHHIFKGRGQVIGEFVCRNIDFHSINNLVIKEDAEHTLMGTCLEKADVLKYIGYQTGTNIYEKPYLFYCWHISDLVIYDEPKELREFYTQCKEYPKTGTIDTPKKCRKCKYQYTWNLASKCRIDGTMPIKRPPQSWCYVEDLNSR